MLNEKEVWQLATDNTIGGDLHADRFARAIEQAVIERLAQGVSVERLKNIDWQQFAMHGGEPCFDLDRDGSLCGRARHWFGHNAPGSFVSLHDFATTAIAAARVQALEEAANPTDDQLVKGVKAMHLFVTKNSVADLRTTAAEQGWNAALDQAAAIVLADCVNPPKTEYQHQYNATLKSTAAQILKLKEST